MSYSELIQKLFHANLFGGVKLGLNNCHRLQEALGYPTKAFTSIHVAGTNGKGSVTLMTAKALEAEGHRVGLYTSPHISCFRERIRINGEMITEAAVERLLSRLFDITKRESIPATFFELTTFLAFLYFAEQQVDIAVLETGLGGRLDATNVVTPMMSIITSISLDHTEVLGTTIEQIAKEKGGIIKPKVPVIIGPRVPYSVIASIAKANESPLIAVSGGFSSFIEENQAIARMSLQRLNISPNAIEEGLKARQPCRMEVWNNKVVLDVAHNADGLASLFHAVSTRWKGYRIRVVFGLSKSKDIASCLQVIARYGTAFHLVEASNGRGLPLPQLFEEMGNTIQEERQIRCHDTVSEAVQQALSETEEGEIVVIAGTFFIMSEARQALGFDEPVDAFDMNERVTSSC